MSTTGKKWIGVLSLISFLVIPIMAIYMFLYFIPHMVELSERSVQPDPFEFLLGIGGFVIAMIILSMLSFGLMIYFIIHAAQDMTLNTELRVVWIIVLFFASNLSFPFYWYFRIWKANPEIPQSGQVVYDN